MKQLAAVALAAAMVGGAVAVRGLIDDDNGSDGEITLICPTELEDACRAASGDVAVRAEPAPATAAALEGAASEMSVDGDAWLVPAAWATSVNDQRERAGLPPLLGEPSDPVARSPVAVVVWADRADTLTAGPCNGTVGWSCLGDAAGRAWGDLGDPGTPGTLKVGLTDPNSATGLVVLGGAASGFFGSGDYASNDFGGGFQGWLDGLASTAGDSAAGDPVARMLTRGQGELTAAGALEVDARTAAGRPNVTVLYPAPVVTADLVVVPIGGSSSAAEAVAADDDLRRALSDAGWRVVGEPLAEGLEPEIGLPDDDGLPSGGVLRALLARWNEVVG